MRKYNPGCILHRLVLWSKKSTIEKLVTVSTAFKWSHHGGGYFSLAWKNARFVFVFIMIWCFYFLYKGILTTHKTVCFNSRTTYTGLKAETCHRWSDCSGRATLTRWRVGCASCFQSPADALWWPVSALPSWGWRLLGSLTCEPSTLVHFILGLRCAQCQSCFCLLITFPFCNIWVQPWGDLKTYDTLCFLLDNLHWVRIKWFVFCALLDSTGFLQHM